jgi:hypothetical protein
VSDGIVGDGMMGGDMVGDGMAVQPLRPDLIPSLRMRRQNEYPTDECLTERP